MGFLAGRFVGSGGQIYAFEPQPSLASKLSQLMQWKGWSNIAVENFGVSSEAGQLTLNMPGGSPSPGASLEVLPSHQQEFAYEVDVTTLDEYFSGDAALDRLDFVKCDTEGHELEVFRGGRQLLQTFKPTLLFECEARHRSSGTVHEVFSYLEDLGYEGAFLGKHGLIDIQEFDPAKHQVEPGSADYATNFVFTASPQMLRAAA